ncbi:FlhC family transcriptional regulator [Marinobacter salicampi]|uniref:FlhC family transcriptional regulator n=1 Tax=Marinobacter salicampi TaxID=435907 RepID=UPI00140BC6EE|nr:FlhC family transcriptional regulator [Marinobacter salicampi]
MNARNAQLRLSARRMLLLGFPNQVVEDCTNMGSSQRRLLRHEIKTQRGVQPPDIRGPVKKVKSLTARGGDHLHASLVMNIYCAMHPKAASRVDIDAVVAAYKTYTKEIGALEQRIPRAKQIEPMDMASVHALAVALRSHEESHSAEMRKCKSCFTHYYLVYEQEASLRCPFCEWRVRGVQP